MSKRILDKENCYHRDVVVINGIMTAANGADGSLYVGGAGIKTIARTGEGAYTITFSESHYKLLKAAADRMAATPADLKGHTVVFDTWTNHGTTLDFVLYNASDTADDLLVNEYLSLEFKFLESDIAT